MTVVLIGNTRAGRGSAGRLFHRFSDDLEAAGYRVVPLALGEASIGTSKRFDPDRFRGADAVIAFGGDGTVNAVAGPAAACGTPVYHVPTGNENLFARTFRMTRDSATLVRALQQRTVRDADTGTCNHQHFLIMVSVGPDAGVIKRLHAARTRALGHLAYVEPILREARHPTLPRIRVAVDGRTLVDDRRGWLVVANIPEYGGRLNPATHTGPFSGDLDAVFMPAENLRDSLNWLARAWTRQHRRDPRCVAATGTQVVIESDEPLVYQLDGEFPDGPSTLKIDLSVMPRNLPVLCP